MEEKASVGDRMTPGRGLAAKNEVWLAINQRKLANQVAISSIVRLWLGQSGESEADNGKFPFPVLKSDRPRETIFKCLLIKLLQRHCLVASSGVDRRPREMISHDRQRQLFL